jgi:flagellar hook-basal body complex protein FliE
MSNFQLPPLIGFDPMQKPRFQMPSVMEQDAAMKGLEGLGLPQSDQPSVGEGGTDSTSFGGVLANALGNMRDLQDDVQAKTRGLMLGEGVELHDVMLAADKSEVTFNLMLEVRNKLVDAWEKLSRSAV